MSNSNVAKKYPAATTFVETTGLGFFTILAGQLNDHPDDENPERQGGYTTEKVLYVVFNVRFRWRQESMTVWAYIPTVYTFHTLGKSPLNIRSTGR